MKKKKGLCARNSIFNQISFKFEDYLNRVHFSYVRNQKTHHSTTLLKLIIVKGSKNKISSKNKIRTEI